MVSTETITLSEGRRLIEAAFVAEGVPQETASSIAQALVAAEAEGQVGHGFSRVSDYLAQVRSGKVRGGATPLVEQVAPSLAVVDACYGFAYPALDLATSLVAEVARTQGTATVAVTRSHHCGALSVQVERVARRGAVVLMFANTPPAIAPWGAVEPLFGTNPIAFACPVPGEAPLVADLSLSVVARGKIMAAKKAGETIPEGWALDAKGKATTDPDAALAGSMLPIGGAKGTVLAMIVEVLAAAFTGANLSRNVASFFAAEGPPPGPGQLLIALRPPDPATFAARVREMIEAIVGADGARLTGARRRKAIERAEAEGIAVPTAFLDALEGGKG